MGNPKQKWTSEEEEALKAGIAKHGTGKWKDIQRDPEFHPFLSSRSNIDLKDKWRNMSISAGLQGSRDKSRTSKTQANSDAHPAANQVSTPQPSVAAPAAILHLHDATAIAAVDDSSKGVSDGKTAPLYNAMIFEALSTSKDPNGLETSKIFSFIEQRLKVPPNFRKLLSSRLRRLVAQGKIEKVENYYKMKSDASCGTRTPVVKQESQLKRLQNVGQKTCVDPIEKAALAVASRIAEAENKAFELSETIKEQERISKMVEENQTMLDFAKELFERCNKIPFFIFLYEEDVIVCFTFCFNFCVINLDRFNW